MAMALLTIIPFLHSLRLASVVERGDSNGWPSLVRPWTSRLELLSWHFVYCRTLRYWVNSLIPKLAQARWPRLRDTVG